MVISTSYGSRGHLEILNLEFLLSILLCQLRIKFLINYVLMISFRSIPFTSFLHNLPLFFSHENARKSYSCYYHKKNLLNYPWRSLTNRNCSRPKLITELFSAPTLIFYILPPSSPNEVDLHVFPAAEILWGWNKHSWRALIFWKEKTLLDENILSWLGVWALSNAIDNIKISEDYYRDKNTVLCRELFLQSQH